jgi:DNA-binding transcriptional ArsR family regulator
MANVPSHEVYGIFAALGEPVRRLILELLSVGEQPAGWVVAEVQSTMPMSQPAVSQHLKVLRDAGLVTVQTDGARRLYALDPSGLQIAVTWLASLSDPLAPFAQPMDALGTEIARGRRAGRVADSGDEGRQTA